MLTVLPFIQFHIMRKFFFRALYSFISISRSQSKSFHCPLSTNEPNIMFSKCSINNWRTGWCLYSSIALVIILLLLQFFLCLAHTHRELSKLHPHVWYVPIAVKDWFKRNVQTDRQTSRNTVILVLLELNYSCWPKECVAWSGIELKWNETCS